LFLAIVLALSLVQPGFDGGKSGTECQPGSVTGLPAPRLVACRGINIGVDLRQYLSLFHTIAFHHVQFNDLTGNIGTHFHFYLWVHFTVAVTISVMLLRTTFSVATLVPSSLPITPVISVRKAPNQYHESYDDPKQFLIHVPKN
jgi:hypothetical protein